MKTKRLNRLIKVTLDLVSDCAQGLDFWASNALEFLIISGSVLGEIIKPRPDLNQPEKFEQGPSLWPGDKLDQGLYL